MLGPRSTSPEVMDDMSITDERIDAALKELTVINRFLGGNRASLFGIRQMAESLPRSHRIRILDCGAGGADLVNALRALDRPYTITSLDLNFRACHYSKSRRSGLNAVNGSAFKLPFRDRSFDLIHAAMFCHHFDDKALGLILHEWSRVASVGIVINDLRRSAAAFLGITFLTKLLSRSPMVRNDAPLSVRRGFQRDELAGITSGYGSVTMSRHWAYRWLVTIAFTKEQHGGIRL